jgi:hypothetical protein
MSATHVNGAAPDDRSVPSPAFDQLEAQALALEADASAPGGVPGQAAAPAIDNAAEILGALQLARMMVAPMFKWWPEFKATWTDETLEGIATGGGAVMDKHGWTMGGLMNEFGAYIALATATAPPVFITLQAIKANRAEQQRPPVPPATVVRTAADDAPNQ